MAEQPGDSDLFTAAWESYRTMVECDYLWHSMVMDSLDKMLARFTMPIRFLDLACGDAEQTTHLLQSKPIGHYVGVDRSGPALAIAVENVQRLTTRVNLVTADFVEFLEETSDRFDVIYVGLSAHHLNDSGLPRFFKAVRRCLATDGVFVAFEPFLLPDEVLQDYGDRFRKIAGTLWVGMTTEQRKQIIAHICEFDFPLTLTRWNEIARDAGLSDASILMKTPDRISMLVSHVADQKGG